MIHSSCETVVIACDQSNARSVLTYQKNIDKIAPLSSHSAMGVSGPNCDFTNFSEYVAKNIQLYAISNDGTKLSTAAQASYTRNELATALRKGPYQVNVCLGGYDESTSDSSLYIIDYMGTMHKVNYGCQGYASYFCLSVMDRAYKEGLGEEDALEIIQQCIFEMKTRFLVGQPNYMIKIIDKDGVRTHSFGEDPADT